MVITHSALQEAVTAIDTVSGKKRICQKSSLKWKGDVIPG